MAKTQTLEDFIRIYVNNKKNSHPAVGYAEWLGGNGIKSREIYSDALRDIVSDSAKSRPTYGKESERLAGLGLTSSGYAQYLESLTKEREASRRGGALEKYIENELSNVKGYGKYLEGLSVAEKNLYEKVEQRLYDLSTASYDWAYRYAIESGLSEEDASELAKKTSEAAAGKAINKVLDAIVNKELIERQAKQYALSLGLGETKAAELGEYARKMNSDLYYSRDYSQYLKDKANSNK